VFLIEKEEIKKLMQKYKKEKNIWFTWKGRLSPPKGFAFHSTASSNKSLSMSYLWKGDRTECSAATAARVF
jgi:hypothetical protein